MSLQSCVAVLISVSLTLGLNSSCACQEAIFSNADWLERSVASGGCLPIEAPGLENPDGFDITNVRSVLLHVLKHCKKQSFVYPTEQYFYFKFRVGPRLISGNLRFCNSKSGIVNFGYFDEYDHAIVFHGAIKNGVNGAVSRDGNHVRLTYFGVSREFELNKALYGESKPPSLLEHEEVVSRVQDESGYLFQLVFDRNAKQFFYILLEAPEELHDMSIAGRNFLLGKDSRFAFLEAGNRQILIGVLESEIKQNSFFDGPFDQVPPFLDIRDKLMASYPYLRLQGGIDRHGNFLNVKNMRVAISPYIQYQDLTSLAVEVESNSSRIFFHGLVREPKMDFHKQFELQMGNSSND